MMKFSTPEQEEQSDKARAEAAVASKPKFDKKPGKPIPAHVMKKFKEKNAKSSLESNIRKNVDIINEMLEAHGELKYYLIPFCSRELAVAITEKFRKSGWTVAATIVGDDACFTITLD